MIEPRHARVPTRYVSIPRLYTLEQAEARVAYWQRVLRLSEWDLRVVIARASKMGGSIGRCQTVRLKKSALIELLDPVDFEIDTGFMEHYDMELTIIHELLHVRTDGMIADPPVSHAGTLLEVSMEQAVHALSMVLAEYDTELLGSVFGPPS